MAKRHVERFEPRPQQRDGNRRPLGRAGLHDEKGELEALQRAEALPERRDVAELLAPAEVELEVLEALQRAGLAKNIGVCNLNSPCPVHCKVGDWSPLTYMKRTNQYAIPAVLFFGWWKLAVGGSAGAAAAGLGHRSGGGQLPAGSASAAGLISAQKSPEACIQFVSK